MQEQQRNPFEYAAAILKSSAYDAPLLGSFISVKFPSTIPTMLLSGQARILTDALLSTYDQEERLSMVYVQAIAARAGYSTAERDLDRDGIDLSIQAGGAMRVSLDLQLKATINLGAPRDGAFHFRLPSRNHNLLCLATATPRLLVVLDLPRDESQWMTVTHDELILRRCAYWANFAGRDESDNAQSVTVPIPEQNLFDVPALQALMQQTRSGRIR